MNRLLNRVVRKISTTVARVYEVVKYGDLVSIVYSQEGEDVLLNRIFNNQASGFYVDVGAHHPVRFSNTYHFYKQNWSGINIEPNPDAFTLFEKARKNDINLNCGIANKKDSLKYYMFNEPALNTFSNDVLRERTHLSGFTHIKTLTVDVLPLAEVLEQFLPPDKAVDFLSIDVEGFDLEVLKSNNWSKFRPRWVLVEQLNLEDIENLDFDIHHFMKTHNYVLFAKMYNTLFYKEISHKR